PDHECHSGADDRGDTARRDGVQQPGEDVATALVPAEQMLSGTDRGVDHIEIRTVGVEGRDPWAEDAESEDHQEDRGGDDGLRVTQEPPEDGASRGRGRGALLRRGRYGEDLAQWSLAFGFSQPFVRSAARFTIVTSSTATRVTPMITGTSIWREDVKAKEPYP